MLLEYLEKLSAAETIEDAWQLHVQTMQHYDFDRLLYGFTRSRTGNSFGDPSDILILSNHDPGFLAEFIEKRKYFEAPMVRWAAANVGVTSWRHLSKPLAECDEREVEIIKLNQKWGITAGYSISFPAESARSKGAIGLVARKGLTQDDVDKVWAEHGRTIHQMNNALHLKLISLPHARSERKLTARQREVLEWVSDGKTIQDIAVVMGLTPATIEKHLRLARETLGVDTTAQAIRKASLHNQIFLIEAGRSLSSR